MGDPSTERAAVLVGGDSVIGRQFMAECGLRGISVSASTRRGANSPPGRFFLDLAQPKSWSSLPETDGPVVLVAAVSGFDRCASDLDSEVVNIDAPVEIARRALARKRRVIFVSTNSVFDGSRAFCAEDDPASPTTAYAAQKAETERRLKLLPGWDSRGAIVRFTKVLSCDAPLLLAWRKALDRGKPIAPFSDLVFAPVSIQFAARSLADIACSPHCGTMHVSGAADITYADLAYRLADALGLSSTLVKATTSGAAGIPLLYRPLYGALSMSRTQKLTGIAPQNIDSVVDDVLQVWKMPALH